MDDKNRVIMKVFFEEPFWVGIIEHNEGNKLSVCKITFGKEPKDYEVYYLILKKYFQLQFSPVVETVVKVQKMNPKRMQRMAKKEVQNIEIGTKSQIALKLQQEQMKTKREQKSKEVSEANKQYKFSLRQQKKKEKHRGH